MTRRLYDENAYCKTFTATVLSCGKTEKGYAVVLDATAFFPEGGGQAPDGGTLNGVAVTDVQLVGETVVHTAEQPFTVGETVTGAIDWETRYSRMQQHTGEHIVSGLVHTMKGYDNVGFHMGADCTTVDFSGKLTDEEIAEIQKEANRVVMKNRPVRAWCPEKSELETCVYRSKKEIDGALRLVEIEGTDLCACCAPHVASTAEVGPIVILGREVIHGGTRLMMLCGMRGMAYLSAVQEQNKTVSAALSAKPTETAAAVNRLQEELGSLKLRLSQTTKELYAALAEANRGAGNVTLFRESGDAGKLATEIAEVCGGVCRVFVKTENGWRYAMAQKDGELSELCRAFHAALGGKGGGRGGLVQGSLTRKKEEIEDYLKSL